MVHSYMNDVLWLSKSAEEVMTICSESVVLIHIHKHELYSEIFDGTECSIHNHLLQQKNLSYIRIK